MFDLGAIACSGSDPSCARIEYSPDLTLHPGQASNPAARHVRRLSSRTAALNSISAMLSQNCPCFRRVVDFQSLCQLAERVEAGRRSRTAIRPLRVQVAPSTRTTRSAWKGIASPTSNRSLDPPGPILSRAPLGRLHMAAAGRQWLPGPGAGSSCATPLRTYSCSTRSGWPGNPRPAKAPAALRGRSTAWGLGRRPCARPPSTTGVVRDGQRLGS